MARLVYKVYVQFKDDTPQEEAASFSIEGDYDSDEVLGTNYLRDHMADFGFKKQDGFVYFGSAIVDADNYKSMKVVLDSKYKD